MSISPEGRGARLQASGDGFIRGRMLHSPAMTEVVHSTENVTRWKRLGRSLLRRGMGGFFLTVCAGGLVGAGLGILFYRETSLAVDAELACMTYGWVLAAILWLVVDVMATTTWPRFLHGLKEFATYMAY